MGAGQADRFHLKVLVFIVYNISNLIAYVVCRQEPRQLQECWKNDQAAEVILQVA